MTTLGNAAHGSSPEVPQQRDPALEPDGHGSGHPVWPFDPMELALDASAAMAESDPQVVPDALCPELGRRLLLAQLQYSRWVLRRVEKVEFERERTVSRRLTIEFLIRPDAPRFKTNGREFWLVPLSTMRRRTLVNLDLRDEHGESVSMPGLRLAQQLDQSVLLAAASVTSPESVLPGSQGREFIRTVVAGRKVDVETEFATFEKPPCGDGLDRLRESPVFTENLYRLRRNFTLYLFLDVEQGRHRLLRMSFDEPTSWKYQVALLEADRHAPRGLLGRATAADRKADPTTKDVWRYEPGYEARRRHGFWSAIGMRPTQIRFQVPSAEHCASYHFEAKAPLGLRIVSASLVAGRPNNPWRHVSADYQDDHSPTVGLHATQIPYGSLCRAQVRLRVPTRGWLTTLWVSCGLVFAVLGSVAWHWHRAAPTPWTDVQATNVSVLLVSTSAGVATMIAQREFGGLAARLLVRMRGLGLVAISLPIMMAGFLAYSSQAPGQPPPPAWQQWVAYAATAVAGLIAAFVTLVWWRSKRAERRVDAAERRSRTGSEEHGGSRVGAARAQARGRRAAKVWISPWDMTRPSRDAAHEQRTRRDENFADAVREYGFDEPSIGIRSAEGWHEWYSATDESHRSDIAALEKLAAGSPAGGPRYRCSDFGTSCVRHGRCRRQS